MNIASDLKRNDPLLLSNHLFYVFCITLLVQTEILKLVQRLIIAYPSVEITNQFKASFLLLLRYATTVLAVMSCFFVILLQVNVLSKHLDQSSCFCYGGFL